MQQLDIDYEISTSGLRHREFLQVMLLLIISSLVFVSGIGRIALTDPDEGRYAVIGRNMIERNNFLEPWLGEKYYSKKPVLFFELVAKSFTIFGVDNAQFSARIVPVIGSTLTVLATYLVASAMFNPTIGLMSGGCLLSCVIMLGFGKFLRMDMYMVAFLTFAFWSFLKGYKEHAPSNWFLLMYPFVALALLTKGPIGLVLPVAIIFIFLIWQWILGRHDWKILGYMRIILGLAIMMVLAGPWYMYMEILHKNYLKDFIGIENLGRMFDAQSKIGHHDSALIYLLTIFVGLLPWTGFVILAIARYSKSLIARGSADWEARFLFVWFGFVLIFFSISETKMFHYVLPAFVPLSIILARFMYDYWQSDFLRRRRQPTFAWASRMVLVVSIFMVLIYISAGVFGGWVQFKEQWTGLEHFYGTGFWSRWGWLITFFYRLLIAMILIKLFWFWWRNWQLTSMVVCCAISFLLLGIDLSYTEFPRLADLFSCKRLAAVIEQNADPSTLILEGPVSDNEKWTLPFYLPKTYTVKYVQNIAELSDYYKNPGKMIYLSRNKNSYNQVIAIMRNRAKVLARYRSTSLLLIKEKKNTY